MGRRPRYDAADTKRSERIAPCGQRVGACRSRLTSRTAALPSALGGNHAPPPPLRHLPRSPPLPPLVSSEVEKRWLRAKIAFLDFARNKRGGCNKSAARDALSPHASQCPPRPQTRHPSESWGIRPHGHCSSCMKCQLFAGLAVTAGCVARLQTALPPAGPTAKPPSVTSNGLALRPPVGRAGRCASRTGRVVARPAPVSTYAARH